MPYNGSGVFSVVYNWAQDAANGIKILASRQDTQWADVATNGLTNCVTKDGQTTTTAAVPFAGGGIKTDTLAPVTASGPVSLTAGQILFPSTQNPSSNVNTLDDYEEGTYAFTDASGASLVFTSVTGFYVKVGQLVYIAGQLVYPATANAGGAAISLPFTAAAVTRQFITVGLSTGTVPILDIISANPTFMALQTIAGAPVTNATMSGTQIAFSGCYQALA